MSVWVLLGVTLFYVAAVVVMFRFSHQAIEAEALEKAGQALDGTVQRIENRMAAVEVASRNMLWNVERHLDNPDGMASYCIEFLENNPGVEGCAIALDPAFCQNFGGLFMVYAYRSEKHDGDILLTNNPKALEPDLFGSAPYMAANWFFIPMKVGQTCWVRPHVPNDTILSSIVTCSTPIRNQKGEAVGIFAADISLDEMSRDVLSTKPYPNSSSCMLGVQGTYLIHSDSTKLYHRLISDLIKEEPDERIKGLVESMLAGETGYRIVTLNKKECYVFYEGINDGHWSACIVCPESDIFSGNNRLLFYMVAIIFFGLLFIVAFCLLFVTQQLHPLNMLAKSAQRIARGDFSESIPQTDRRDEVGNLQESFRIMQQSLAKNIEEAQFVSDELQQQNDELNATYAQVLEADHAGTNFIHKIADKMISPVLVIDSVVDQLRKNPQMKQKAIQPLADQMMANIKTFTNLLDQLLKIPQEKTR